MDDSAFQPYHLPDRVRMRQHVHEALGHARTWATQIVPGGFEMEFFYTSTDPESRVIDGFIITHQVANIGDVKTPSEKYLLEVDDALAAYNATRRRKPFKYLIGHHHFHPGACLGMSNDDVLVYKQVAKWVYNSMHREVLLDDPIFEQDAEFVRTPGGVLIRNGNVFDPELIVPVDGDCVGMPTMRTFMRYAYAFITRMGMEGDEVYSGLALRTKNLFRETARDYNLPFHQPIEIIPSPSLDVEQFCGELEDKISYSHLLPREPPPSLLSLADYRSLFPTRGDQELTAREMLAELDHFFMIIGERGRESHPSLRVLYDLLQHLRELMAYDQGSVQIGLVQQFLSGFSTEYAEQMRRIRNLRNGDEQG
ncbi:MAG: hypothetical protein V1735_06940 [Nanoarchaeota archaeon]